MIRLTIAKVLEDRGKKAYWLAKQTSLSYATVDGLVKGKKQGIEFSTLDVLCRVLECQPGDLIVFEEDTEVKVSVFEKSKERKQ